MSLFRQKCWGVCDLGKLRNCLFLSVFLFAFVFSSIYLSLLLVFAPFSICLCILKFIFVSTKVLGCVWSKQTLRVVPQLLLYARPCHPGLLLSSSRRVIITIITIINDSSWIYYYARPCHPGLLLNHHNLDVSSSSPFTNIWNHNTISPN